MPQPQGQHPQQPQQATAIAGPFPTCANANAMAASGLSLASALGAALTSDAAVGGKPEAAPDPCATVQPANPGLVLSSPVPPQGMAALADKIF